MKNKVAQTASKDQSSKVQRDPEKKVTDLNAGKSENSKRGKFFANSLPHPC